jgi:ADP-ribose pyrophosphatase YjhB (NUDIX family)
VIQRKVTAFVTRDTATGTELCVFWHAGAGVQVPAGTVEDGEDYETAARREAAEETGLDDLELVQRIGVRTYDAPENHAWLLHNVKLQTRPDPQAPVTSWQLGRVQVRVVDTADGHARVLYEEADFDAPEADRLVYARLEGWVPLAEVAFRQERAFFHFRTTGPAPESWLHQAEPEYVFHLRWTPLPPKAEALIPPQQAWLDEFHDALTKKPV